MINIGIICPSEIAFRRFLPALKKSSDSFNYVGVAIASPEEWLEDISNISEEQINFQQSKELEKAGTFVQEYGGKIFRSYEGIITSNDIDAIYVPLPPALHYKWAKLALQNNKHVFVEKPSTAYYKDTADLVSLAKQKGLALHENYMFVFHNQIQALNEIVENGDEVGTPRLYRISFGFPRRTLTDFRYNKKLGGGALLDAGCYTIRYATLLLGPSARLTTAQVNYSPDFSVEIFGSATMVNDDGMTAQLAFGMDNDYKCDIEIWGSKGTITSNRILTAPVGFTPSYTLKQNQTYTEHNLPEDDAFNKSILRFIDCVNNQTVREKNYEILLKQSELVDQFRQLSDLK